MLEDELLLVAGFEAHRVLVERSDTTRQFHPGDQIYPNSFAFLSPRVEEGILNVLLCPLGFHLPISFFRVRCCAMSLGRAIGGSSLPVGSYDTALSRAFQLPAQ